MSRKRMKFVWSVESFSVEDKETKNLSHISTKNAYDFSDFFDDSEFSSPVKDLTCSHELCKDFVSIESFDVVDELDILIFIESTNDIIMCQYRYLIFKSESVAQA